MSDIVLGKEREIPFDIEISGNNARVVFHNKVTAIAFFHHGYLLQNMCDTGRYQDVVISNIFVDLSLTEWFDTLALCYLFLFLFDSKEKNGNKVYFVDPENDVFDAFLNGNGFKRYISELMDDNYSNYVQNQREYSKIHECYYPFTICDKNDDIETVIASVLENIDLFYVNKLEPQSRSYLINKLSYFLHETIENVFEHAYDESGGKCGLLVKCVKCHKEIDMKKYHEDYLSLTPYLASNMYEDFSEYLEIYVLDTGVGLRNSFFDDPNGADKGRTDKDIINYIFTKGERSHKKLNTYTHFGGLYDIQYLFAKDRDGLGLKADSTWLFSYENDNSPLLINTEEPHGEYDKLIHGFALVASLSLEFKDSIENKETSITAIPKDNISKLFSSVELDEYKPDRDFLDSIIDYRIGFFDSFKETSNRVRIVYIGSFFSKTRIFRLLYECRSESLILFGIQDAEIKKYQSIIENTYNRFVTVKKVIVVTSTLTVSCYSIYKKAFCYSKELTKAYISSCDCIDVRDSYIALLLLDKFYNSMSLWTMIGKMDNAIYLNAKVKWDSIELRGYLDFSQLCRIPECRQVCVDSLIKLKLLYKNVYFNSIDRFADELCEKANNLIEAHEDDKHINIGSVFVSGTSNRYLGDTQECYYYFCHPDSTDKSIKSLLFWPNSNEWFNKKFSSNSSGEQFERLGYSSFISRAGSKYLLSKHFDDQPQDYPLNITNEYEVLQRKVGVQPSTIRIGHFECPERHDLFGYRITSMFDADRIRRHHSNDYDEKSVFDFLFYQFFSALCGSLARSDIKDALTKSLSGGMEKALIGKIDNAQKINRPANRGVLVYLSDFQTEYLTEKIEEYFNREITNRIIPLLPISRNYEMGTLIVSPLVLDRIVNQIKEIEKEQSKVTITVFVSVAYNVRLLEEIKQILYGIGAGKVRILTVLDRRRISMMESLPSILPFCRVDVYSLNTGNNCAICSSLDIISKHLRNINNEYILGRIDQILKRWKTIRFSDNDFDKGLDDNSIQLNDTTKDIILDKFCNYLNPNISIVTDSALNSLVLEYSTITSSAELLIELLETDCLLENKQTLTVKSDDLKMLLASSYLLFFARTPISYKQAKRIVLKLCNLLDEQTKLTQYTMLSVIALISLPYRFKKCVLDEYEKKAISRFINTQSAHSLITDALISRIILYLDVGDAVSEQELECYVRCYLTDNESKLQCLFVVFMFVETVYKQSHARAYSIIQNSNNVSSKVYIDAIDYTKKLRSFIQENGTYLSLFHDKSRLNNKKNDILSELNETIESLERLIKDIKPNDPQKMYNTADSVDARLVKDNVSHFIEELQKIQSQGLYLRSYLNSDDKKNIINWFDYCKVEACKRTDYVNDLDIGYVVYLFDSNVDLKTFDDVRPWFYSFYDVTEEVINLFVDIILNKAGKITNSLIEEKTENDAVVVVNFKAKYVNLHFINATNNNLTIEEIREKKKSKEDRNTLLVFKDFEKRINTGSADNEHCFEYNYRDEDYWGVNDRKVFEAVMNIPYISKGSKGLS